MGVETQFEDDLMAQHKRNAPPPPPPLFDSNSNGKNENQPSGGENQQLMSATELGEHLDQEETQVEKFLSGKKLYLTGLESEQESELVDWITEAGGDIVSIEEKNEIDYLITGLRHNLSKSFSMVPRAVLTHLWLDDCFGKNFLVPILYYHQPITIDLSLKPCEGAVIGISNYSGRERTYISTLAQALGMVSQEVFAKREKNGAKKNTHLVCKGAEGTKYEAAINWKIPVVSYEWLLKCLEYKTWVSEEPFWVGNASVITPGKPLHSTLPENVQKIDGNKIEEENKLEKEKEKEKAEKEKEEDDEEIVIKRPKTPLSNRNRRLTIETPEVDLERFRPQRFNLDATNPLVIYPLIVTRFT